MAFDQMNRQYDAASTDKTTVQPRGSYQAGGARQAGQAGGTYQPQGYGYQTRQQSYAADKTTVAPAAQTGRRPGRTTVSARDAYRDAYQADRTQVAPAAQGQGDGSQPQDGKKGILSEFSGSAVIASALASVTSFALQSKIGLVGSLIGVGVAAAATTIASQVYKGMLSASAEKLKGLSNDSPDDDANNLTRDLRSDAGTTQAWATPVSLDDAAQTGGVAESGTPIAPQSMRNAAQTRHDKVVKRRTAIVLAAAAIAAVLVYALVVNLATAGQGIGPTTTATTTQTQSTDNSQTDSTADNQKTTDSDNKSKPDSSDKKKDEKGDSTSSSGTSGTSSSTDSGTGTSSNSGTSTSGSGTSSSTNSGSGTSSTSGSGTSSTSGSGTSSNSGSSSTTDSGSTSSNGSSSNSGTSDSNSGTSSTSGTTTSGNSAKSTGTTSTTSSTN
ncbi:MAG: hypothetical protein LKG35_08755 [Olsenella sp.]|nr:hypothetical protein [Olsenella sp.]